MNSSIRKFKESVINICPTITKEEQLFLEESVSISKYESRDIVIKEGEVQENICFVISGLIRGYYINEQGEEITIRFVRENGYAIHYSALLLSEPSKYYFQCIEDTTLLKIPINRLNEGYRKYKGIERFGRLIAEQIHIIQQKRIENFLFLDAKERYLDFLNNSSELLPRISITDLSSYLGIKRQSLSRIRKNISKQ